MFKTAGMRFMQRGFSALSIVSLAALLGACAQQPTNESGKPENWVVENVKNKTTADLTADFIAPGVFVRSNSKVINGYTVESGMLRMPDKPEGSLVTVRSADGSLTALIDTPEKGGLLRVDSKGGSYFISEPQTDPRIDDWVEDAKGKVASSPVDPASAETYVIDLLMGYSQAGLDRAGGDALADSLAKIEYINMALRNSLVTNVSFRLIGIQVVEQDYLVTTETLGKISTIFAEGISTFKPDVVYGNFLTTEPGGAIGWANRPGRFGIGIASGHVTFAHELGHNAGSTHCNVQGVNDYRFGYFNGRSGSLLCGANRQPYYSNPDVKDEHGLPRGDAVTANTARVWREQARRLSSYAPPPTPPTAPGNFAKVGSTANTITFSWSPSPKAVRYEIYSAKTIGSPTPKKIGDSIGSTFTATNISGEALYFVKAVSLIDMVSVPSNTVVTRP
ncbi:hypothetical protein [Pseudomonas izuensis]|uniref:hypothetical protein n=1 Tax=Pseudomonas izuensis TaxID=2684212 RepID=UPI00135833E1|nr:hypothetical protein [Pseudomonas izuensis]